MQQPPPKRVFVERTRPGTARLYCNLSFSYELIAPLLDGQIEFTTSADRIRLARCLEDVLSAAAGRFQTSRVA